MPDAQPLLSLIVPTRRRTAGLRRLLDSLADTARRPDALEVVLVVDADDPESVAFRHGPLRLTHVVVPPGLTMGRLNRAGADASRGAFLMLLNDDVVARTPGWDEKVLRRCRRFADGVFLVHVNDTLMRENLCTFPLVSRRWCELAGGVCPAEYVRYRIDDHIEDVFNLLAALGCRRTVYLPDVVFEHLNAQERAGGVREYHAEPAGLAADAPLFLGLFPARKELALRLLAHVRGRPVGAADRRRLAALTDPFALRTPRRLRVESDVSAARRMGRWARAVWQRGVACWRRKGALGLARAAVRVMAGRAAAGRAAATRATGPRPAEASAGPTAPR
jgi:hypothetical protein